MTTIGFPAPSGLRRTRSGSVRVAVRRLPANQRPLVEAPRAPAGTSYAALSRRLGMPLGSVGPKRGRAVARLRRDPRLASVISA
jgi:DNA-directed RNA polymerase specialized sigma24 family protein